jgi:hypothetical protein
MQRKTLVVLSAVAILGVSSTAMARSGGMAMHASGSGMAMHGHGHFVHHFKRNLFLLGGWGWDGPYSNDGYGNTIVVVSPPPASSVRAADVTGSTAPCHWNQETFTVPSSAGGTRPITVASCR